MVELLKEDFTYYLLGDLPTLGQSLAQWPGLWHLKQPSLSGKRIATINRICTWKIWIGERYKIELDAIGNQIHGQKKYICINME